MIRIDFIDDHPQHHFYDPHIIERGMWLVAYDNENNLLTYIPTARIHKYVDLGKSNTEKK
jgi:hypothetical protein